jgi:hypothetical protein
MLMQEVEMYSSASSTFDRIHAYVAGATSAFECNRGAFDRSTVLLVLTGACARTQKCLRQAQVRDSKEKAQMRSNARITVDIKSSINHSLCTRLGPQQGMTFDASQMTNTTIFFT